VAELPVAVVRHLEHYPAEAEMVRVLRSLAPQTVLLSVENLKEAVAAAKCVETTAPGVYVLALGESCSPDVLLQVMRAGVREFLQAPFDATAVREAVARALESAERAPRSADLTDQVFSFLPAKAGAGASTVALNISAAFAELPDTRVLLADFDLNSGLIGFMLKIESAYSTTHAAENAFHMDENLWRQIVTSRGLLDVLAAGQINLGFRIEPAQIRSFLDYARRHYKAICLDLSGNLEKYSVEIMHESKRVFLVCTSELPSLHLAREKLSFLRSAELEDRVSIILNRVGRRDVVRPAEVEKLLGMPVHIAFPNDYKGVHSAVSSGKPVEWNSDLGKRFRAEAKALLSGGQPASDSKRRFVEYFSIVPARYSLAPTEKKPVT
jgi:pilus assembly protein CpaE